MRHLNNYLTNRNQPVAALERPSGRTDMVRGESGGFLFPVSDMTLLDRALILGTANGTFYANEQKLTKDTFDKIEVMLKADYKKVLDRVGYVASNRLAAKPDNAIAILAIASSLGIGTAEVNKFTMARRYSLSLLPVVCQTGTHMLQFVSIIFQTRGIGRSVRAALQAWFDSMNSHKLALQVVKYFNRAGVTMQDVLRLAHVKPGSDVTKNAIFNFIAKGFNPESASDLPGLIVGAELVKRADNERDIVSHIKEFNLPLEAIPTEKRSAAVYEALLPNLGMMALVRALGTLGQAGVLKPGAFDNINIVTERLNNAKIVKKSGLHPYNILVANLVYSSGVSLNGRTRWTPVGAIEDALEAAYYASFDNVVPTGKRIIVAIDGSASMNTPLNLGNGAAVPKLTCRLGAVAQALLFTKTERNVVPMAFSRKAVDLNITARMSLHEAMAIMNKSIVPTATNAGAVIEKALADGVKADAIICITDNENWNGRHLFQLLKQYREKTGIMTKLVSIAMQTNNFSVADPTDAGSMDIVGFSADAPLVISNFIKGEF